MNKKIVLIIATLVYSMHSHSHVTPKYDSIEMTQERYDTIFNEKKRQVEFHEKSVHKNEASETGFTKTNIGLGIVVAGLSLFGIGMFKSAPLVGTGVVTIGTGGIIAYTATQSRRQSEENARKDLITVTESLDKFVMNVKITDKK